MKVFNFLGKGVVGKVSGVMYSNDIPLFDINIKKVYGKGEVRVFRRIGHNTWKEMKKLTPELKEEMDRKFPKDEITVPTHIYEPTPNLHELTRRESWEKFVSHLHKFGSVQDLIESGQIKEIIEKYKDFVTIGAKLYLNQNTNLIWSILCEKGYDRTRNLYKKYYIDINDLIY